MLEEPQKKAIQKAYSTFLKNKALKARSGQKQMIAEIARYLGGITSDSEGRRQSASLVTVIEAGTGTGKTVGYVIPAVIMALAAQKRLVISTATVTLQEQIISKDLPDIILKAGLAFSFTLAKGRGRYVCLSKLDLLLQEEQPTASLMDMFMGDCQTPEDTASQKLYQQMLEDFSSSKWAGDRDSWPDALEDQQWRTITTDHAQCTGRRCGYFVQCPFFKARGDLDAADVIVTNHDLVLADLALGGGSILPDPQDCIYIFDEGHHLPDKAIDHFACHARIRGSSTWLKKANKHLKKTLLQNALPGHLGESVEKLIPEFEQLITDLEQTRTLLHSLATFEPRTQGDAQVAIHRFPEGKTPPELKEQAEILKSRFARSGVRIEKIAKGLQDAMDGDVPGIDRYQAELLYPDISALQVRLEGQFQLWLTYTHEDPKGEPPSARWLKWSESPQGEELEVFSSPILSSSTLWQTLWNPGYAAIVTSATLAALGSFSRFRMRSGIPPESQCVVVPSPFQHAQAAQIVIPDMHSDPRRSEEHTEEIIKRLPALLSSQHGALVLFSSRRQMNDVFYGVDPQWRKSVLLQDDYSRQELLKRHRQQIDEGHRSILFGLASLAEGIDLPGKYCEHVIIAKIPFAVPDDPVESALSDWLESQGRNPFMEITVPDAAIRLVQACGRLLRTEQDSGRITLLDRRVVTARYGQMILNSLPPFQRSIEYSTT